MEIWTAVVAIATFAIDLVASGHAILNKRDTRAAIAWIGFIWFVPLVGSLLYFLFGVNRIRRKARTLRSAPKIEMTPLIDAKNLVGDCDLPSLGPYFPALARAVGQVSGYPLVSGNRVEPLDRVTAFPSMLSEIEKATRSITLSSYIFGNDPIGHQFVEALTRAMQRGVAVRVLVDDVGSRYSWPTIMRVLRRAKIPCTTFFPRRFPLAFLYANLRNHRKILVVDGVVGFTGGMNIRHKQSHIAAPPKMVNDLHFRLTGPIVLQLQHTFADDWHFACDELLEGDTWFPPSGAQPQGSSICRAIIDGPDENLDNVRIAFSAALSSAQRHVCIMTPYFLPDLDLIGSLSLAALRGVEVDIVLPSKNNFFFVEWASMAMRWQMLERGCRFWMSPPPFDHTKLMVVDGVWSLFGSTNWDPRSLRLNFEFNVECYDALLAGELERWVRCRIASARPLTLADVDGRTLPIKLRDGIARLFSPYL